MADSPELKFVVTGDTSDLDAAIRRAKAGVGEMRSQLNAGAISFAKWGAAGAAAGAAIAVAITRNAADAGKEIANLARVSGTGVVEFQKMAAAANEVGIEQGKLGDIFKDLRDRVGDFIQTGGGPMVDFFERVAPQAGVTAEQFRKLSGPQALQLFVDTMEKAGLSSNEMAFQMEAMASDATALLPLLKQGGAEMQRLGDAAEKAGQVLSEIEVARLQQAAKDMAAFDRTIGTLKNQLGAELAPILAGIGKLIEDAASEAGGFGDLAGNAMNKAIDAIGFVADAVEGVRRSFEVAGKGLALFALTGKREFLELTDDIVNGPVRAVNELIDGFNRVPMLPDIPPVQASDLGKNIEQEMLMAQSQVEIAKQDIHDTLMEPLPSTSFKQWADKAEKEFDRAAKSAQDRMAEAMGGEGLQDFAGAEADKEAQEAAQKEAERHRQELQQRLERIRQANLTEQELMEEKRAADQEALRVGFENEMLSLDEFLNQRYATKAAHEKAVTDLEARNSDQRRRLADQEARARQQAMGDMWSNLTSLMGSESRKMFEIGKAAAIGQTIISTITGAQEAYKALAGIPVVGPALGTAAAAAATLAGAARVQQIRSQSFGGGGSASVGAGGGAGAGAQAGQAIGGQQEQSQTMFVQGINPSDMFTGEQLVNIINTAQENGAQLRVASQ